LEGLKGFFEKRPKELAGGIEQNLLKKDQFGFSKTIDAYSSG